MTDTNVANPTAPATPSGFDLRQMAGSNVRPLSTADLANERARCESIVHACDMADQPSLNEVQESNRAARRIEEINLLIGKSNGTPEQLLQAMKISLQGLLVSLSTRGKPSKDAHGRGVVAFDATILEFGLGGMRNLIDRIERSQKEVRS